MDEIIALTKERMSSMAAESKIGSDAIAKSLRCYDTKVHPVLIERLSIWWEGLDRRSVTEGRTFIYNEAVAGMKGSNLMNYVFQSFYKQEPNEEVEVIYPRVSRKTSVLGIADDATDMFSEVRDWLGKHYYDDEVDTVQLRQLASEELGEGVVRNLLDDPINSLLSQGIRQLLFGNEFTFPSNEFVKVNGRKLSRDLRMKTKYYPSRDDLRAYCSDSSRLRSLVASCLNRMFSPKSMRVRKELHSARILRPDKKDILDLHLPPTYDEDLHTYLILADISNFTGSFANAWLMLYCMGLEVACGKLEDRHQLFSVGGKFLVASWGELLFLYIYLTVGVPCWVEDWSAFAYLSGGFLGVGGNITIGLLCLAVVLNDLLYRLSVKVSDYRTQAGGDDIAILIRCHDTDLDEIISDVEHELMSYIGKIKELSVYHIEEIPDGVIDDAAFCRKRINLKRDCDGTHLTGEPSVPIPASLFPSTSIRRFDLQIQAWRELDYNLQGFDEQMPGYSRLTDTLRQLFLEKYRRVIPLRTHTAKHLTSSHRVLQFGTILITDVAHNVVCEVRSVQYLGITALSSYEAKLRHALVTESVSLAKVDTGEEGLTSIVMTKAEVSHLNRTRWAERIHIDFDEELLDSLRHIVDI
eukprot:scaffold2566_cov52-Cylindrotheca_fusiformis.AAC.3